MTIPAPESVARSFLYQRTYRIETSCPITFDDGFSTSARLALPRSLPSQLVVLYPVVSYSVPSDPVLLVIYSSLFSGPLGYS